MVTKKKKAKPVEVEVTKHPDKAKEWQDFYQAIELKIKASK